MDGMKKDFEAKEVICVENNQKIDLAGMEIISPTIAVTCNLLTPSFQCNMFLFQCSLCALSLICLKSNGGNSNYNSRENRRNKELAIRGQLI